MKHRMVTLVIVAISIICLSVSVSHLYEYSKLNKVIGKRVDYSCIIETWPNGHIIDTFSIQSPILKLCYYIDSTQCFGCQMKWLSNLDSFFAAESKHNGLLEVLVVVSPSQVALPEVDHLLKYYIPQNHSVFRDTNHQFLVDNPFLKNNSYHMFLTDDSDRIICVGNTTMGNKKLKDLYEKRINEYLYP